jgi:glycosyltransferase involved in cell wall biosynthesis
MGHTVKVITPPPQTQGMRAQVRALMRGKSPRNRTTGYNPFAFLGENHIIADYRKPGFAALVPASDIVVATWWETAFAVQALPPEKGTKVYFVQHHEVHAHLPAHISAGSYYLPMKKITIAGWLRDTLQDVYGAADVPVVHNSVDHEQFHAPPRPRRPVPTIGFMYADVSFKGADLAMRAIEEARHKISDLEIVAFGKGAHRGKELPKGTRYFRQPPQDHLRDIYAMCDGWLMPSHSEGFALPVLEAMACRTPVISTRTGIAPDIIEDGRNGYLVDPGDAAGMADRIFRLLSQDQATWSEMSEAAHAAATRRTWQDATLEFEEILLAEARASRDRSPNRISAR